MSMPVLGPGRSAHLRLSDSVYETLLEAILSGKLAPGTIVSEVALAKQLNVSRTPVHDALGALSKDGLVEQRAGRRAVIASFSQEDLFDVFEMRILLEAAAARRAAKLMDPTVLTHLRALAEELRTNRDRSDWLSRWTDFDEACHEEIAKASGSKRLWQDVVRYRMLHRGFNKLATTIECLEQALNEHFRILDALEAHDPDAAEKAMAEHIQQWQKYFVSHFPR